MRLSISTKIFLGFAVVIVAFGSACAYTIYRMNALRESMAVVWQDVVPVTRSLRSVSRRLRAPEEFLTLRRPSDGEWLQRLLPTLKPFEKLEDIEARLRRTVGSGKLTDADAVSLREVADSISKFRKGDGLKDFFKELGKQNDARVTSQGLFRDLVKRTVAKAAERQLKSNSPETRAMIRSLRKINRVVITSLRELTIPIRTLNERAASDEKAATLAVILIASGALILSLLMLFISQLTLAPIRSLREGVRRIAEGHLNESVTVRSKDEIGQLADEFNKMAGALIERDAELERKKEELLHRDRLATIGKLAAQITHEVRNPLLSIGLNAELIEDELRDVTDRSETLVLASAIQQEVQRLKTITEGYLQYARLPQTDRSVISLVSLIGDLFVFLDSELSEAKVDWKFENGSENDDIKVEADSGQLRTALLNIVRNAIEAMTELHENKRIFVSLNRISDEKAQITITDTGPGIEASVADRIFQPFVSSKSSGTGLGLALTREIIIGHGGEVTWETGQFSVQEQRVGTTFRLVLPTVS